MSVGPSDSREIIARPAAEDGIMVREIAEPIPFGPNDSK
jgi:hypothetical protein